MQHEIRLYGPIGGYMGFTAEEIMRDIPEDAKQITLRIHSPGGSVGEGLAIYHALKDHPANVLAIVDEYAASSASFVMLAGDQVQVHRNSIVFVHNPWTSAEGNADELRKTADGLDVHADAIRDIYMMHTGLSEDELRDMMEETAFFRGVDAVENGFADMVIDSPEAEAQIAAMQKMDALFAQHKENSMSTQKTRTVITKERDDALEQLATAQAKIEEDATASAKMVEDTKAELVTAQEQVASLTTERDELATAAQAHAEDIEALSAEVTAAKAETKKSEQSLAKAQAALKDPAYAQAALEELGAGDAPKTDADADAAEAAAIAAREEEDAKKPTIAKMKAIEDKRERTKYFREHKDVLMAESNAQA